MKKTALMIMVIAVICFLTAGCATLTTPVTATTQPVGSKVGQATGKLWFTFFGTADVGVRAAAENGGIKTISTIDITKKLGPLGFFTDYTTTVTGE